MRKQLISSIIFALAVIVALCDLPAFAQNAMSGQKGSGSVKTDSRILYHNGPIRLRGSSPTVKEGSYDFGAVARLLRRALILRLARERQNPT